MTEEALETGYEQKGLAALVEYGDHTRPTMWAGVGPVNRSPEEEDKLWGRVLCTP